MNLQSRRSPREISGRLQRCLDKPLILFVFFWAVAFVLYLPASRSGLEGDFVYWALTARNDSFLDFINTKESALPILYQFSQAIKYVFFYFFGVNPIPWHLLHVTLHALVGLLMFRFCRKIMEDSRVAKAELITFFGTLLFLVAPHSSEVVVRELCYHYQQGFIFILLIFWWLLQFLNTGRTKYAWWAAIVYFISLFTLEIFYLTPWLLLLIMLYYRAGLRYDNSRFKKGMLLFFVPEILMFLFHLLLLRILWGNRMAHIGTLSLADPAGLLAKPILYFFHILFLGRYFPQDLKMKVYEHFQSPKLVYSVYGILALTGLPALVFFRRLNNKIRLILVFTLMAAAFIVLATPLDFATILLVIGDRYIYIASAFMSVVIALTVSFIKWRPAAVVLFSAYFLLNVFFTLKTDKYWYFSASIYQHLLSSVPDAGNKKILLLNLPSNMNGALMIRANPESEFKVMNNLFYKDKKITNEVYDVCAYNMLSRWDGAHVTVANDSSAHVTLNQWGAWWWYGDIGAESYENKEYKVIMRDVGHWYELVLKHPASEYLILYQVGRDWKVVDWNKKNVDQN